MKFRANHAGLSKDKKAIKAIEEAAERLLNKLQELKVDSLPISDYNKKYLGTYTANPLPYLQRFSYILYLSIANSSVPLSEFVFLDYGGGSGILSLLAKELNVGRVIYSDIYDVSCQDAALIGEAIGDRADSYINGDIDDVLMFFQKSSISCNAIASNDTIEHIYDIESFIGKLPDLSNNSLNIVMSTSANGFNLSIRKTIMDEQIEIEYEDRVQEWGHKERDSLKSYSSIRKEIIGEYKSSLAKADIEKLAKYTRGFIEKDIKQAVDRYLQTGEVPPKPQHPTNTCDPYTGNWAEHLINPYDNLVEVLKSKRFRTLVLAGYYGNGGNSIKQLVKDILNFFIWAFPQKSVAVAGYWTLFARKEAKNLA